MNNKPKMIIFDYGNTLLHEPDFDFLRGDTVLFDFIKSNPQARLDRKLLFYI